MEQRFFLSVLIVSVLVWGYSCGSLEYAYSDDIYYNPETDNPVKKQKYPEPAPAAAPMIVPDRNEEVVYINQELKAISDSIKGVMSEADDYEYADRLRKFHSDEYSGTYFDKESYDDAYYEGYNEGYHDSYWNNYRGNRWGFSYGYSGYGPYWGLGYNYGWSSPYYNSWYSHHWHHPHYYGHYSYWDPWYSYPAYYPSYSVVSNKKGHRTSSGHTRGVNSSSTTPEYKPVSTYRNSNRATGTSGTNSNVQKVATPKVGRTVYTRPATTTRSNYSTGTNTYKTKAGSYSGSNTRSGYTPSYRRSSGTSAATYNRSRNYNTTPSSTQKSGDVNNSYSKPSSNYKSQGRSNYSTPSSGTPRSSYSSPGRSSTPSGNTGGGSRRR